MERITFASEHLLGDRRWSVTALRAMRSSHVRGAARVESGRNG